MPLPLLSTDYFTKPEPTGSISGIVARMMASAGEALSARVEKYSAIAEAKLKAPALAQAYQKGYARLAAGDMGGFADMASGLSMSAGNPLLSQMAKEASDLGVHLANNSTQQMVLQERLKSQDELQTGRLGATADRQYEREFGDYQQQHSAWEKRKALHDQSETETAKLQGRQPEQFGEPEPQAPIRTSGGASRGTGANPLGLPAVEPDLPTGGANSSSTSDPNMSSANRAALAEAAASQPQTASQGVTVTPQGPAVVGADGVARVAEATVPTQTAPQPPEGKVDKIAFGDVTIEIGQEPKAVAKEVVKGRSMGPTIGVQTRTEIDDADLKQALKDRTEFVEALGEAHFHQPAAVFAMKFMRPNEWTGDFVDIKKDSKGHVDTARLVGYDQDGKEVPFSTQVTRDESGKITGKPSGTVDGDFYDAWKKILKLKDKVYSEFGMRVVAKEKTPEYNAISEQPPEIQKLHAEIHDRVYNKKELSREQGDRLLNEGIAKFEKNKDVSKIEADLVKKYIPDESEAKARQAKSTRDERISKLQREIKQLDQDLTKGVVVNTEYGAENLSAGERRRLILLMANKQHELNSLR